MVQARGAAGSTSLPGDGTDVAPALPALVDRRDALPTIGQRVPVLDGLRGVAILMVMIGHFAWIHRTGGGAGPVAMMLFGTGGLGVDLFFVLSGFLITGILLDTRDEPAYFRNFYARRTVRIFPLYYGVLLVTLIIVPIIGSLLDVRDVASATPRRWDLWLWTYTVNLPWAWPGLGRPEQPGLNFGHFWTLAVEEQFYLCWPLVVFVLGKRRLAWAAIAGILIALGIRAWTMAHDVESDVAKFFTLARFDGLCVGALLAVLVRGIADMRSIARWSIPIVLACLALLPFLLLNRQTFGSAGKSLNHTIVVAFFGAAMMILLDSRPASFLHRAITQPVLLFYGKYSYALYIFHYLLKLQFERWFDPKKLGLAGHPLLGLLTFILIASTISTALAFASWHLYEKHFLKLKRSFEYNRSGKTLHLPR